MRSRWPVRLGGPAIALALSIPVTGAEAAPDGPMLVVRHAATDAVLARLPIGAGDGFALRYRNSLYGSLAEERFSVRDGRMTLRELAADQLAVLEEYYAISRPASRAAPGDARRWTAAPGIHVEERRLRVAATDLGERTLIVDGSQPLDLWRLVDDVEPIVVLAVDR